MKFRCQKCTFEADTYEAMRRHSEETRHPYQRILVEQLKLDAETKDRLVAAYTEQVLFALDIIDQVKQKVFDTKKDQAIFSNAIDIPLTTVLLERVITPAVYLEKVK
jgi:hypothetical protein